MSGKVGDLSLKQAEILAKFKENVKDILKPQHDDYYVTRWLRARNYDLKKAESMLRNDAEWRIKNNVDTILDDFKIPEVLQKYYVGGICGRDKQGAPIWIDPFGDLDIKGILCSARKQDIVRNKIHTIEKMYKLFEEETTPKRRIDSIVVIFDLNRMGMKHLWKPGVDVLNNILAIFEEHYPETLKATFMINAPRIFPIAFSLVRPFLSEATVKKTHILGSNYTEVLLKFIDAEQLPVHYGGLKCDPDGNPKCRSLVNLGGEIPREYYCEVLSNLDGYTEADLGRGSSLQLDFDIKVPYSVIRWQFKTDGFDIGFGIFRRTKDQRQKAGEMEAVLPSDRVNSHLVPEDGSTNCTEIGTYVVRFDNTYSWARTKKLFYLIEILEPSLKDLDVQKDSISQNSNSSYQSL